MPTLVIMNYGTAEIEIIELSSDTVEQFAGDYDKLVFNSMGYKPTEVHYMVAESINIVKTDETKRLA